MQVLLVRHAQPTRGHNPHGPADPGLSELGALQAQRLGAWLAHEPIDLVVTSPKRRAIETVQAIVDASCVHEIEHDFDELDRRSNWYFPTEELATHGGEYWDAIVRGDFEAIGWDPPEVFRARVVEAWNALLARRPGDVVVVGCHGGVIHRIVGHVLGVADGFAPVTVGYASITRIEVSVKGQARLTTLNETAHFEASRERVAGSLGSRPLL